MFLTKLHERDKPTKTSYFWQIQETWWLPQSVWSLGWLLFLSIFIFIWLFFFLFVFLSIHQSVSQLASWRPILGQSVLQSVGKSVCQSVCLVWYGPTERQMDRKILVQFNHIWSDPVSPSFCLSMSVYLNIFSFNCLSVSETFGQSVGKSIWQSFSQSVNLLISQTFSQSTNQSVRQAMASNWSGLTYRHNYSCVESLITTYL
jgi:hypothetical protein